MPKCTLVKQIITARNKELPVKLIL